MTDKAPLVIDLAAGTPAMGVWCEKCLLPSAVIVPVHRLADDGPHQFANWTYCERCAEPTD